MPFNNLISTEYGHRSHR